MVYSILIRSLGAIVSWIVARYLCALMPPELLRGRDKACGHMGLDHHSTYTSPSTCPPTQAQSDTGCVLAIDDLTYNPRATPPYSHYGNRSHRTRSTRLVSLNGMCALAEASFTMCGCGSPAVPVTYYTIFFACRHATRDGVNHDRLREKRECIIYGRYLFGAAWSPASQVGCDKNIGEIVA